MIHDLKKMQQTKRSLHRNESEGEPLYYATYRFDERLIRVIEKQNAILESITKRMNNFQGQIGILKKINELQSKEITKNRHAIHDRN